MGEVAIVGFVRNAELETPKDRDAILVSSKYGMSSLRARICQLERCFPKHGERSDLTDVL